MTLIKVLIDVNICLDVTLSRKPFVTEAAKITEQSEQEQFKGIIAAHSFDTLFYLLNKHIGRAKAYQALNLLRRAFDVADVTQASIDQALQLNWHDFEDAIHYAAAQEAGCDAIITRNKKDFNESDLPILSPVEFLDQLDQE